MGDQVTCARFSSVVMSIEVNDTNILFTIDIGEPSNIGVFDGVITTDDDRDRTRLSDFPDHTSDRWHTAL